MKTMESDEVCGRRKLIANTFNVAEDLQMVRQLCEVQARPKTTSYLLWDISSRFSQAEIGRIYRGVNGEPAPKGQLPASTNRLLRTAEHRLHASYIVAKFKKFAVMGYTGPTMYLKLYHAYLRDHEYESLNNALLNFEQMFAILKEFKLGNLVIHKCREGAHLFVHNVGRPISKHTCPVCSLLRSRAPSEAQTKKKKVKASSVNDISYDEPILPGDRFYKK
jgi:hypothetical protein